MGFAEGREVARAASAQAAPAAAHSWATHSWPDVREEEEERGASATSSVPATNPQGTP